MSALDAAAKPSAAVLTTSFDRVLEYAGIFVFALSGGLLAARKGFDVVGMVVLAVATALGGGLIRDALIGSSLPVALRSQGPLLVASGAALAVLLGHRLVERLNRPVLLFDAAGLGFFSSSGRSGRSRRACRGLRPCSWGPPRLSVAASCVMSSPARYR